MRLLMILSKFENGEIKTIGVMNFLIWAQTSLRVSERAVAAPSYLLIPLFYDQCVH